MIILKNNAEKSGTLMVIKNSFDKSELYKKKKKTHYWQTWYINFSFQSQMYIFIHIFVLITCPVSQHALKEYDLVWVNGVTINIPEISGVHATAPKDMNFAIEILPCSDSCSVNT